MGPNLKVVEGSVERSTTALAERLEDGYRRIDEAERCGADVSAWEAFWLKLLHEYELLCDELEHAA
jgi:hypothetical protein